MAKSRFYFSLKSSESFFKISYDSEELGNKQTQTDWHHIVMSTGALMSNVLMTSSLLFVPITLLLSITNLWCGHNLKDMLCDRLSQSVKLEAYYKYLPESKECDLKTIS